MAKLTIARARKILGKVPDNVTDEEIEKDIKVVEMFKNLFYSQYLKQKPLQIDYNNSNGKI